MAIGQKTLKIQDTEHNRTEGTTDIQFVSEAVYAKLEKKYPNRYKVLGETKEKAKAEPERAKA